MHGKITSLLGADWDRVAYVLITGHRRENFGSCFEQICDAHALNTFPAHSRVLVCSESPTGC